MAQQTLDLQRALASAQQLQRTGDLLQAEAIFQQILTQAPHTHAAWHGWGLLCYQSNNLEDALKRIARAIAIESSISIYHRDIGEMLRQSGRLDKAIEAGQTSTRLSPNDAEAHYNLGVAYASDGQNQSAIDSYRKAIQLKPQHIYALNNLGSLLGEYGDIAAAINCYQLAIEHRPDFVDAHCNLSAHKKYQSDDSDLAMLRCLAQQCQQDTAEAIKLTSTDKTRLFFCLGKALEDIGDYKEAFNNYQHANQMHYQDKPFNEEAAVTSQRLTREIFTREFVQARKGGCQVDRPLFIVGMPRSGTTLVEQILCSHPEIYGAGEIVDFSTAMKKIAGTDAMLALDKLNGANLTAIGSHYIELLQHYGNPHQRVSNKMPTNFLYLGLIHLALPNAKIIHVHRDPMDSCFSCYAKLFTDTMEFSYNLDILGRYYIRYRELMQHWQSVLPEHSFMTVHYEALVNDFESQAKRMIDYIDLPWDQRCLNFHTVSRSVKTASVAQVRKPIYRDSLARWQRFEQPLQPLLDMLTPYRKDRPTT